MVPRLSLLPEVKTMLMRNPEKSVRHESVVYTRRDHTRVDDLRGDRPPTDEPFAIEPRHQMLFGQLALIALFCLAILLRTLA
ncbi:hypothetical protein Mal15_48640 [Stieleria maiorica]|uniref:Uncharacterized protein n=1 Tax=Stieleria maiorica TaxID=2795974 RepID=A0A5B9MHM4_9BACT|nr:hypothetical protein [Stieleria maiorica]QEG00792.1 hypothetical protein Mal15_48640 [Stieleria maiorica]